jgi:hypothetical protein
MLRSLSMLGLVTATLIAAESPAQTTYRRAELDANGQLVVTPYGGRAIPAPRDSGQVAFSQVAISPDRSAVGWTALHPNCCTTYPVPLELVILRGGKTNAIVGNGLPIWRWRFSADGRRVALRQGPVHGGPMHYELRDIRTGHLVGSVDSNDDTARLPRWARAVR